MKIYYENSNGQIIDLLAFPYKMLSETTLFDYKWDYVTEGTRFQRIKSISKQMIQKAIKIRIQGNNEDDYLANIEHLSEVFDTDITSGVLGKLYVNDYYLECYIEGSTKTSKYLKTKSSIVEFQIIAENGNWKTNYIQRFGKTPVEARSVQEQAFLDYPYDYSYDYVNAMTFNTLLNDYAPSDFEITIYGKCVNPVISIGDWNYGITGEIKSGERLIINSADKKIYKITETGMIVNMFSERFRDFYPYQKIQPGENIVGWNGSYSFDIQLYKERSEPKWT